MTSGSSATPAVLRIGWRRSWLAPHLRRRLLAGALVAAGVLLALSSVHRTAVKVRVASHAPVTVISGLAPGLVASPVRLADADVAPLLQAGMWVDVLAAGSVDTGEPAARPAGIVARDVQILSVEPSQGAAASAANTSGGTLIVLAVSPSDALALAEGEASGRLSVTLLG